MKLEIDLDLNQIDYEAINKQIQEKIDAMDIKDMYQLNSKIEYMIKDKVEGAVNNYLTGGVWCGLNDRCPYSRSFTSCYKCIAPNSYNHHHLF